MFKNLINKFSIFKKKIFYKKNSYSFGGVDLLVNYLFKNINKGTYIDVGAQNPVSNNNTYLLYKRGWNGINIDLDLKNIELFNLTRNTDINICAALSSSTNEVNLYFYHEKSSINTIEKKIANLHEAKFKEIKKIKTITLNAVVEDTKLNKINYLNIDVEGHELEVLKGFDLIKHKPDVISVEYLDLKMKKLEFKNNNLNSVLSSELYKHMIENNYSLINWSHADLIFINNQLKN
jgi:FkbM family methyltransferase